MREVGFLEELFADRLEEKLEEGLLILREVDAEKWADLLRVR